MMKTFINRQLKQFIAIFAIISGFVSCIDNKFEFPIEELYNHGLKANISIAEVKAMYTNSPLQITQDLIVEGYVCSSDKEGNIFKTLYIQDETGGLPIVIDQNNINNMYRVGRKVLIKLKDMYIGTYSGLIQLGMVPEAGSTSPSRIPATIVSNYIVKDYEVTTIEPEIVTISQIASREELVGKLIRIDNVQFSAPDATYATETASTNRTIEDQNGNSVILRNSNYSTFALLPLPTGSGSITAVLSVYATGSNKTYQLLIRDTSDVAFNNPRFGGGSSGQGDGSENSPYNIAGAKANQGSAGNNNFKWVTGYIVGVYETGVDPFTPSFTTPFSTTSNVIIADTQNETNISNCIVVQIPTGQIRTDVNPAVNPSAYKKKVWFQGSLEAYFSTAGLKNIQDYRIDNQSGGGGGNGDGTFENPYDIDAAKGNQGAANNNIRKWVRGYIVGAYEPSGSGSSSTPVFSATITSNNNVLIAASPNETNISNCIPVQLPAGDIRNAVNLNANASNYKREVILRGTLEAYYNTAGLKNADGYWWTDSNSGVNPDEGGTPGTYIFNETLLTQTSYDKFSAYSIAGEQAWTLNTQYGAVMSGYADNRSYANEDWFISPAIDLSTYSTVKLNFEHARGPQPSMNYGIAEGWYKVYVSNDYNSGSPASATWTELTGVNHGTASWTFVSSGNLNIPSQHLAANFRIAFKYICSDTESATWEIKNVTLSE